MAVKQRLHLGVVPEESFEDAFSRQGGGQRHGSAGEAFGQREEIRNNILVFAGEHFPGAAEAGHHLVADEKDVVLITPRAQITQQSFRPWAHTAGALNEGLNDDAGERVHGFLLQRAQRGHVRYAHDGEADGREAILERGNPAETGRPGGVAMVGVIECGEAAAIGMTGQLVVLHRHFERDLNGGGSVVGIKNARESLRRKKRDEFFREADGRFVGEAEERAVREFGRLLLDGGDDFRMRVAVDVRPNGTVAVEIFAAGGIDQEASAAFREDQRRVSWLAPFAHLGEGMPEMRFVGLLKRGDRHSPAA